MANFVLKNNFFQFNGEVKRQKCGTAIGTKFAPPYACIFMDEVESFVKVRNYNLSFGSIILTTYFLYGLMEKRSSLSFLMNLITFNLI